MPPLWDGALARARETRAQADRKKRDAAHAFLLNEPGRTGRRTSLVDWLHTTASDNEEKGHAQVRDGEDSLEVILLDRHRVGGQEELRTLPGAPGAPGAQIPTGEAPKREVARAMALSAVRLPSTMTRDEKDFDAVIGELEARVVSAWQADPQLRGQLFLLLEDGRARLAGTTLEYSPTTGLKEVHPE